MSSRRKLIDFISVRYPTLGNLIVAAYGFLKRPMRSYALYGEDILVWQFLNRKCDGVYLDIGAFHSRWISNTHILAKNGWKGIAVDIDDGKMWSFKVRRGCQTKVAAVVPASFPSKHVMIYKFNRASSEYDSLDISQAEEYADKYRMSFKQERISALRIDCLLEYCLKEYGSIDYINVDIEGVDEEVIMSIDPDKYGIGVISFENNKKFGGSESLKAHLRKCGFVRLATQGGTHTYVSVDSIENKFPEESDTW